MDDERGIVAKSQLDGTAIEKKADTAIAAQAEHARAMIESKFMVALNRPRDIETARVNMLKACKRPLFADAARYKKPVGNRTIQGMSVKFADEAVKIYGNVDTSEVCVYEDEEKRLIEIRVLDLETNLSKSKTVMVRKTVERRKPRKGQEIVGQRENTHGDIVYIVKATEDEMLTKELAMCAKMRRNLELQILPWDIVQECEQECESTLHAQDARDPDAALRRLYDAFAELGIGPKDIAKYLKHDKRPNNAEIDELRQMYRAMKEGEARWVDFAETQEEEKADAGEQSEADREMTDKAKAVMDKAKKKKAKGGKKPDPEPEHDRPNYKELSRRYDVTPGTIDTMLADRNLPSLMSLDKADNPAELDIVLGEIIAELDVAGS